MVNLCARILDCMADLHCCRQVDVVLARRVLLKIVYLLTCRILSMVAVLYRGNQPAAAEVLVLRHENAVLRRQAGRVRYAPAGRVWFAALARIVSRRRWAEVFPVTPATLLAWHRRLVAKQRSIQANGSPGGCRSVSSLMQRAWSA
jgi:putative transposase